MKTNCNIIRDLMPTYIDGLCSEESKAVIEEHFCECEDCKSVYDSIASEYGDNMSINVRADERDVIRKVNSKYRKQGIRNSIVSVIAGIIIFAVLFVVIAPTRKLSPDDYEVEFANYQLETNSTVVHLLEELGGDIDMSRIIVALTDDDDDWDIGQMNATDGEDVYVLDTGEYVIAYKGSFTLSEPYACIVTITSDYPISSANVEADVDADGHWFINVDSVKTPILGDKNTALKCTTSYVLFCQADYVVEN